MAQLYQDNSQPDLARQEMETFMRLRQLYPQDAPPVDR